MGVIGLWSLLEPAGKPVPLESLENKILAIDVSIWLNQAVKGYRDKSGNALTNAHLLGLFHRICKLMFYRIKPVFVFDGKAPDLKKETLQRRRIRKGDATKKSRMASVKILDNYVRSQAVQAHLKQQTHAMNKMLAKGQDGLQEILQNRSKKQEKDLFELPPAPENLENTLYDSEDSEENDYREDLLTQLNVTDIHHMDVTSSEFKSLPKDIQYELLTELTERRKENSWNKMHQMPKSASGFSGFQVQRLLNRSKVQKTKENIGKEIGDETVRQMDANLFVGDVEGLKKAKSESRKIASSSSGTHSLYIQGLNQPKHNLVTNTVESDEDDIEILEPSEFKMSNRTGGFFVKKEIIEVDDDGEQDDEDIYQEEILKVIQSETAMKKFNDVMKTDFDNIIPSTSNSTSKVDNTISSEDESDSDFEEVQTTLKEDEVMEIKVNPGANSNDNDEDLFADIFDDKSNENIPKKQITKLPDVTTSTNVEDSNNDNKVFQIEIQPDEKTSNKAKDDLFADVFQDEEELIDFEAQEEKNSVTEYSAEKMKQTDQLYLKIASKYMEPNTSQSNNSAMKGKEKEENKTDYFKDDLEEETEQLLREMKSKSKENKLLKIKAMDDLDKLQAEETKANKTTQQQAADPTSEILNHLGVSSMAQEDYQAKVDQETFKSSNSTGTSGEAYGDAAEGFTRSKRDQNVQDADITMVEMNDEFMEKLDQEGEEFSKDELIELQNKLADEQKGLIAERGQLDRLAATITDQMYSECQELLQLFGIPWIVSPSEAEAQCAFLDMNNLTHGTITDDSDVWVFGGQRIYKNFFNQEKHCEYFTAPDVAKHFGLSREKLILLAMLTGSDYSDGIETVGPVTGLEILAEFPGNGLEPLKLFKDWWKETKRNPAMPPGTKLKEKLRKLQVPESFPSDRINLAYLNPDIDNSTEKFSWAVPNFVAVRDFASEKFGWTKGKIDEIIKPVIKKLSVKNSQDRIDNFFSTTRISLPEKGHYQSSKRVKEAIGKVLGKKPENNESSSSIIVNNIPKNKNTTKRKSEESKNQQPSTSKKVKKSEEIKPKEIIVQPPKNWKQEEKSKAEEAKRKAIEVMKKTRQIENKKKSKKNKKYVGTNLKRKILPTHNLSESDSD